MKSNSQEKNVGQLIEDFTRDWLIPLERLAQVVFFNEKFQQAVAGNTTKSFLQDRDRTILKESFTNANVNVHVPTK